MDRGALAPLALACLLLRRRLSARALTPCGSSHLLALLLLTVATASLVLWRYFKRVPPLPIPRWRLRQ
eukprot:2892476-Prymnesium_polylepis.1